MPLTTSRAGTEPEPEVVQVMRNFHDKLLGREIFQMKAMSSRWAKVETALQQRIDALAKEITDRKARGESIEPYKLWELGRYQSLMEQLGRETAKYARWTNDLVSQQQWAYGKQGISDAAAAIKAAYLGEGRTPASFAILPVEAVQYMTAQGAGKTTPLRQLLAKSISDDAAYGVMRALTVGTALGDNPRKTAKQIMAGAAMGQHRAECIARTEQLRVYRTAFDDQCAESGVVRGYQRLVAHQSRTCFACIIAEGEIYHLRQAMRDHPNGRCTLIPVVEGVHNPPLPPDSGLDWFLAQPNEVQQKIMGKKRWEMWVEPGAGLYSWNLVDVKKSDVWGDHYHVVPLRDLKAGNYPSRPVWQQGYIADLPHVTYIPPNTPQPPPVQPTPAPQPPPPPPSIPAPVLPAVPAGLQTSSSLQGALLEFDKNKLPKGLVLNGVPLKHEPGGFWLKRKGIAKLDTEPWHDVPGKERAAGVVIIEPDGRIWLVQPKGRYGGYDNTFAKGRLEAGLSAQQNALKEAYEETGLKVGLTGYLGDFEGGSTVTRYYVGVRRSGAPWDAHWETDKVKLLSMAEARKALNVPRDQDIMDALEKYIDKNGLPGGKKGKAPKPVAPALQPLPSSNIAWPQIERVQRVKALGGSTGAELVRDPNTGKLFVMKRGHDQAHIQEECLADTLYRQLGVHVPGFRLYDTPTGPIKLSEYIENTRSLKEIMASSDTALQNKVRKQLQQGFAVDALLANWDVIGMDADNILVDAKGTAWRIDNGGALRRRAQGQFKQDQWNGQLQELWSMRRPDINPNLFDSTRWAFEGLDAYQIGAQARAIHPQAQYIMQLVPQDMKVEMQQRLDVLGWFGKLTGAFEPDKWDVDYCDNFARQGWQMQRDGVLKKLPNLMKARQKDPTIVTDEKGNAWDGFRGGKSIVQRFAEYLEKEGTSWDIVQAYLEGQAGSAWSMNSQAFKWWVIGNRKVPKDAYFWKEGMSHAEQCYKKACEFAGGVMASKQSQFSRLPEWQKKSLSAEAYNKAMTAWHALQYEVLQRVDFENNDRAKGVMTLMRTEDLDVMRMHKLQPGMKGCSMARGAAESCSWIKSVNVAGCELTVQEVPHHRIFACYFFERAPGEDRTCLYGDHENEFVSMLEGLLFEYRRGTKRMP